MSNFEELYCAHVEQIGVRYPDAWHVRYAWAVDPTQIESKVFFGDEAVVFTSVLEPDGTMRHYDRAVYAVGENKSPRERALYKLTSPFPYDHTNAIIPAWQCVPNAGRVGSHSV